MTLTIIDGADSRDPSDLSLIPPFPRQSMALVPARVYTCDICNKDLQNNYNLKRHRQAVHKETKILYGCDECDKDFTTIASYKRHKNMVHGNGKEVRFGLRILSNVLAYFRNMISLVL